MKKKVRIKKLPKAMVGRQVDYGLQNDIASFGGGDYDQNMSAPSLNVNKYLTKVDRKDANVEAEGGETAYGDLNGDGLPEHSIIKGPRHSNGGVPLSLPEDTFIYSDTRSMKIKDPKLLKRFNKPETKSYTPADIAKQYDINKYRKILQDPNSDDLSRKTAELMIKNYNLKLAELALVQEAMKGMPQGIPVASNPALAKLNIEEQQIVDPTLKGLNEQLDKKLESESSMEEDIAQAEELNQAPVARPEGRMMFGGRKLKAQEGIVVTDVDGNIVPIDPDYTPPSVPSYPDFDNWDNMDPAEKLFIVMEMNSNPENFRPEDLEKYGPQGPMSQEEIDAINDLNPPPTEPLTTDGSMSMGGTPMAAYGMSMGGYDMPFYELPEAEYGMPMGYDSSNYMGKKQEGGIIDESDYEGDPEGLQRAIFDAQASGEPVQVRRADGRIEVATTKRTLPGYDEKIMTDEFGTTDQGKAAAAQLYLLQQGLKDPKVKQKFYDEYLNSVKEKESYKGKGQGTSWTAARQAQLEGFDSDDVVNQFLSQQKRNLMFQAKQIDPKLFSDSGRSFQSWSKVKKAIDAGAEVLNPETGEPIKDLAEFNDAKKFLQEEYGRRDRDGNLIRSGALSIGEVSNALGVPLDRGGEDDEFGIDRKGARAAQQAAFHAYTRMMQNAPDYDADTQFAIRNFLGEQQVGTGDETGMSGLFKGTAVNISPIDDFRDLDVDGDGVVDPNEAYKTTLYGNTTAGELTGVKQASVEFGCQCDDPEGEFYMKPDAEGNCPCEPTPVDEKKCPCEKSDGTIEDVGVDPNTGDCNPCEENVNILEEDEPAPWWLQDTIQTTGAFGDLMGLKKYMPWAPRVDLEEPDAVYADPTRELAAQAEQANISQQAIAQFTGPQALSARQSSIQGQAAKQAADTLNRYNVANVQAANQNEAARVGIRNQEQLANQQTAQRLYDQTTMANQQFDNAKRAMREKVRNLYTNAITNRYKTQAMNELYPQYNIDPSVGGRLDFDQGKAFTGKKSGGMSYDQALADCQTKITDPTLMKQCIAEKMKGSTTMMDDRAAMAQAIGYPGLPTGQNGGFIYTDMVFPFVL